MSHDTERVQLSWTGNHVLCATIHQTEPTLEDWKEALSRQPPHDEYSSVERCSEKIPTIEMAAAVGSLCSVGAQFPASFFWRDQTLYCTDRGAFYDTAPGELTQTMDRALSEFKGGKCAEFLHRCQKG